VSAEPTLSESYAECRRLHRAHGTTYYWATRAMPAVKRPHVHALYGLCRFADEIVDHVGDTTVAERRRRLDRLEAELRRGIDRGRSDHIVLKAVVFTARAFAMDVTAFGRFFESMRADLECSAYATFDDLMRYMDGSAAVIGELMLPILEPTNPSDAVTGARDLGLAFQLTNFLRDVNEDLDRGRIYFPADELAAFGVSIRDRCVTSEWRAFCRFQIDRTRALYASADDGIAHLPAESRPPIRAARVLYSEILDQIEARDFDVFSVRARVGLPRKLYVGLRERTRRDRSVEETTPRDVGRRSLGWMP
jgi:15-cis-phytoene synthase